MKKILFLTLSAIVGLSSCNKDDDETTINQIVVDTTIEYVYNPSFVIQDQEPVTTDIQPDFLQEGDLVAVCAASNYVTSSDISEGIATLKSWGLQVIESSNLYNQDGRYAGTLAERINGLQEMIDNPDVKAIFFARGGYGAAQVLPYINWDKMYDNPKWIIGYSDVTALHITLNNMGFESILGPMMKDFNKDTQSLTMLKNKLFGTLDDISITTNSNCVEGTAEGRLVGGNLSIIYSLSGTAFDLNTQNSILFIEDTGENNYAIDRMLLNLQESGKLESIKGLIVGEFINCVQGTDLPINEIIMKYFKDLNIPIVYGIPNGHDTQNYPLILGNNVKITVDASNATIEFEQNFIAK